VSWLAIRTADCSFKSLVMVSSTSVWRVWSSQLVSTSWSLRNWELKRATKWGAEMASPLLWIHL